MAAVRNHQLWKTVELIQAVEALQDLSDLGNTSAINTACKMCLEVHDDSSYCKPTYLCKNQACKDDYLCPNAEIKKSSAGQKKSRVVPEENKGRRKYTEDQEEFFNKLSPELSRCIFKHCIESL